MTVLRSLQCIDDPFCAIRASFTCLGPDSPCRGVSIPTAEECNQDVEIDILIRILLVNEGSINCTDSIELVVLTRYQEENDNTCQKRSLFDRRGK